VKDTIFIVRIQILPGAVACQKDEVETNTLYNGESLTHHYLVASTYRLIDFVLSVNYLRFINLVKE
jgi:hypothetical protein